MFNAYKQLEKKHGRFKSSPRQYTLDVSSNLIQPNPFILFVFSFLSVLFISYSEPIQPSELDNSATYTQLTVSPGSACNDRITHHATPCYYDAVGFSNSTPLNHPGPASYFHTNIHTFFTPIFTPLLNNPKKGGCISDVMLCSRQSAFTPLNVSRKPGAEVGRTPIPIRALYKRPEVYERQMLVSRLTLTGPSVKGIWRQSI